MPIIEELDDDDDGTAIKEEERERRARYEAMEEEERERVEKQFALGEEFRLEGNNLLAQGKLQEATSSYEKAKQELTMVGNLPESRRRAEQANLALHLNMALANLRLENYTKVKDECASALVLDPRNVKALYRRGMAQATLARRAALFQEAEARAACADFEALLAAEPGNAQAEKELLRLRSELKAHARDLREKQKETWGAVFGGRTETGEEDAPDVPLPALRPCKNTDKQLIFSLDKACVVNQSGKTILKDMTLEVREAWCVGFCGSDLPAAVALTQLVQGKLSPSSGNAVVHEKKRRPGRRQNSEPMPTSSLVYTFGALFVLLVAAESAGITGFMIWAFRFIIITILAIFLMLWRQSREPLKVDVAVATWKPHTQLELSPSKTMEEVLCSLFQRQVGAQERRDRAEAMLHAAGIKADTGSALRLKMGQLSAEQQRVVHVLRCIARRPEVLICEDPFQGFSVESKARLLRMLKRMKQMCSTSILFLSSDLDQVSYLADSLGLLVDGKLLEKGPTLEVLQTPRDAEMQAYIAGFKERTGQQDIGGEVQAKCTDLLQDAALDGAWIPPKYT